jgi:hypothetical protein
MFSAAPSRARQRLAPGGWRCSTTTYIIRGSDLARSIEIGRVAADYYTRILVSAARNLDWATVDELEDCRAAIERDLVALEDEVAELPEH